MTARLKLVECRRILGGEYDPLRAVWDDCATLKDRRLLLAMAGVDSRVAASALAGKLWEELKPEMRAAIAGGLRRWREWAGRLQ